MTREEYINFANCLKNNYTIDFDVLPEFCDMAISALSENKREWIPVIERLPKDGELVLCSVADSNHSVVINCFENQPYWRNGKIYAWQPLPEPYKGGEV